MREGGRERKGGRERREGERERASERDGRKGGSNVYRYMHTYMYI